MPDASHTKASDSGSASNRPTRILVSGASGFIGTHLRRHLAAVGHEVCQLVRHKAEPAAGQVSWDPGAGTLDPNKIAGFDAVVNLSGENIAGRWNDAVKRRIRDSRVKSTRLLAEAMAALKRARPSVFVCPSAIGYYGDRENETLSEEVPPGHGFLADVCTQWEAATETARAAGIRVVNLRIGVVLSPDGGALAKMLPVFRMGMGGVVGSGNQWVSWISLSDLLQVFDFVIADRNMAGPVNAVSPNPVTNRQFTRAIGRVLNRPTILPMPAAAVRLTLGEMGVETLLASARVVPGRLEAAGFQFQHPNIEEALRYELAHAQSRDEVSAGAS